MTKGSSFCRRNSTESDWANVTKGSTASKASADSAYRGLLHVYFFSCFGMASSGFSLLQRLLMLSSMAEGPMQRSCTSRCWRRTVSAYYDQPALAVSLHTFAAGTF
ncbi:hypothetical protein NPIL_638071 [Nephila pilipes]|uniref:Uncharacterized protein n=1 Tax=Nephila pilipes TaxID=299642 RepID=A0A8X6TUG2_NEPPI|nr:hypothetical protein NPIL_638071 [Nephila pilipes]